MVDDPSAVGVRRAPLLPESPVSAIDRQLANRRAGFRTKGPPAAEVLSGIEIETVRDLLHHYPRRYIDRSQVARIRDLRVGQSATVIARVKGIDKRQTRQRRSMVIVSLYDGSGYSRPHLLQPAVDRHHLSRGHRARGLGRRPALPGPPAAREPGGGAPQGRRAGPRPHRADHARAPRDGGHHHADDPRARVARARAARPALRPAPRRDRRRRVPVRLRPRDPQDPLPGVARGAPRRPGAPEVRRAVRARARRRVPQAPGGARAGGRRARARGSPRPPARRDPALRAHRRPARER